MIVFQCHVCRTELSAEAAQVGQMVRCPSCLTALSVPSGGADPAAALAGMVSGHVGGAYPGPGAGFGSSGYGAAPASQQTGRRYGFNCGYCSSRLEATASMAGHDGQCPTCGNAITIPILDRYGRLIDPKTRQIIKQDPHPVHAYAAAGERAPGILRDPEGKHMIRCPRCGGTSPITANNCKRCAMPFTMEGTTLEAGGSSNGFCVASLVLGIIGLPAACAILPPFLAVIFGGIGYYQLSQSGVERGGKRMAIAGIVLGLIGCAISITYMSKWL